MHAVERVDQTRVVNPKGQMVDVVADVELDSNNNNNNVKQRSINPKSIFQHACFDFFVVVASLLCFFVVVAIVLFFVFLLV